jgi:hypothetical protein
VSIPRPFEPEPEAGEVREDCALGEREERKARIACPVTGGWKISLGSR